MNRIRHILSISGGKDSAALAFHLRDTRPNIEFEYVFFDTGEELPETYAYLEKLERALGITVKKIYPKKSFSDLLKQYNGFLPSPTERWCTRNLKLEALIDYVKEGTIYNYIGIRADENRTGLVPHRENFYTVTPFVEDGITLNDVKRILHENGVGLPEYYTPEYDKKFDISYNRTRSGCYFCFFMRQIEWVWLLEKHPEKYWDAANFEKNGYTWIRDMSLEEFAKPENIDRVKESYKKYEEYKKSHKIKNGTMMEEMAFLARHDKDLDDFENDQFCSMCAL
ncbi:phosphoadenosine phosphosulfate reductase family protein [Sulfurospirillum oryzae]|uniref:phosphoadenosine phosphosulfate reductase family protein n=1 Tax=Sulfurospirillum oryzae TaxID=2976535 RepID=UPI0021E83213|nr:phosphoadenosine phosphosulfate reductase family protein [Sulfurospirillum oryzae]